MRTGEWGRAGGQRGRGAGGGRSGAGYVGHARDAANVSELVGVGGNPAQCPGMRTGE